MMPKHFLRAPWGRRLTALVAVSTLSVTACSDSDSDVGPSSIQTVEILTLPNNQTITNLTPGNTRQMLGIPTNSRGNFIDRPVSWISSNPAAATITEAGLLTAVAGGQTWIRATAGGRTDSIQVGVRYPVASIALSPATATLRREGTLQLVAATTDTQGAVVTGRTVTWTTSNAAVATVSASGLVTIQANPVDGTTVTITATVANTSDNAGPVTATRVITVNGEAVVQTVTVTGGSGFRGNVGTQQLTATARSGLNNVLAVPIDWTTSNPAIATVNGTGLVSFAGALGDVTITATATNAGNNNSSPAGTAAFTTLTNIVAGTALTLPAVSTDFFGAYLMPPTAGLDSVVFTMSGGTGDLDLYLYRPGSTAINLSSFLDGNNERITVVPSALNVAGWWRVRVNAFIASTAGAQVLITEFPTP